MKVVIKRSGGQPPNVEFRRQLLASPVYPEAVPPPLIARTDDDHAVRAFMIFESLIPPGVRGKSFLDLGMSHHVTAEAVKRGMRLDPPHDIVLVYDMLDHDMGQDPADLLRTAKRVLAPEGLMVVRCHPWCSRHATHLYTKANKAYLHLLLSERELAHLGLANRATRTDALPPQTAYRSWIAAAGLKVVYEEIIRSPLEPFFKQPQVLDLMQIKDKSLMEIQFVDYVLAHG